MYKGSHCERPFVRFKTIIIEISLVVSLLLLGGCVSTQFPMIRPVNDSDRNDEEREKAQDYFILARDYERRGISDMAENCYEVAYRLDPKSETLRDELARIYVVNEKLSKALILIKGDSANRDLPLKDKRMVATIYIKMGEFEKAAGLLENIPEKSDEEIYSLGLIYESLNKKDKALNNYKHFFKNNPESIQMAYKIGKLLIDKKRYSEAAQLYNDLLVRVGDKPDIFVMLGNLGVVQGDTAKGLEFFSKAITIDSTNEDALRNAAQVHLMRNDYPNAIVNYEKLYNNSSLGDIYGKTLAILYFYNKQYPDAEKLLNQLIQNDIDDYELHYYLGLVFEALDKKDFAYLEFEKTLAIRNTFNDAWKEMCYLSIKEKKYDEALDIAERFTKIVPDQNESWKLKGYVHNVRKEYSSAIESLLKAIVFDSTDLHAWFELGSAYERSKNVEKSTAAFKKVLKVRPDDPATLNYLGYMWAEKGIKLDSAKVLIEKALKIDPENGAFLDSYAWVFFQMGNIDSAFKYMELAMKKIDNDPVAYSHLGEIFFKKGELKKALEAFQKSLDLDAEDPVIIRKRIEEIEGCVNEGGLEKK